MENAVKSRLQSLQFGEVQVYKGIAIVPLIAPADGAFQYNTLGEALAAADLAITEVSAAGSVPELMVVNRSGKPVLLVDGEELAGAKQNRVLNTSILIKEISETKIPVSCTEQGRWAYTSKAFSESGHIMAHTSRSRKTNSVHSSLQASGKYRSDQGEVWQEIAALQAKAGAHSPTSAMHDVFEARADDLRECEEIFKPVPNQVGLLTFIGGRPAGADMVSLTSAYAKLHPKLVRSYALEGLLEPKQETRAPEAIVSDSRKFLDEILAAEEHQFASIGHGTEFRYRSNPSTLHSQPPSAVVHGPRSTVSGLSLTGTALVHKNEVIHAAFFRLDDSEKPSHMASLFRRRRHSSRQ